MVKRCVAAGCSYTHADGISLFSFPRDPSLRALWNKQVQRTRADWRDATDYSVLCSEHFTKDCFEQGSVMASQFGIQKRRRLKGHLQWKIHSLLFCRLLITMNIDTLN